MTLMEPPVFVINEAVNSAIYKGKKLWGKKLHFLNIQELRDLCLNHAWNSQRDRAYKEAHKKRFGLSFHDKIFNEYTSPYPKVHRSAPVDPSRRTAMIPPIGSPRPPKPYVVFQHCHFT